jgi:hypothetical protein
VERVLTGVAVAVAVVVVVVVVVVVLVSIRRLSVAGADPGHPRRWADGNAR